MPLVSRVIAKNISRFVPSRETPIMVAELLSERTTGGQGKSFRGGAREIQLQRFLSSFQICPRIRDNVYLWSPLSPRSGRRQRHAVHHQDQRPEETGVRFARL